MNYLPTCRHEQFSSNYAGSVTPSYGQRILMASSANSHFSVEKQESLDMLQSVSRPVQAVLQLEVKKVD